jgi:hypothetical protein
MEASFKNFGLKRQGGVTKYEEFWSWVSDYFGLWV